MSDFLRTDSLNVQEDGSIPVTSGSGKFTVDVVDADPPRLRLEAQVLTEVDGGAKVLRKLNERNDALEYGRLFWREHCVYFELDLPAAALDADEIVQACRIAAKVINTAGDQMHEEFGGKRFVDIQGEQDKQDQGRVEVGFGYL